MVMARFAATRHLPSSQDPGAVEELPSVVGVPQLRGNPEVASSAQALLDGPSNSSAYLAGPDRSLQREGPMRVRSEVKIEQLIRTLGPSPASFSLPYAAALSMCRYPTFN